MQEFVLSKPGFWSLSLLSYQVVTLTLLAYFLCLAVFLATRILFKRFEFFKSFSPLFFTYLSIFSILFTLRFLKNSEQHLKLALLIIWFVISIVTAFFVRKKILNSFKDSGYRHSNVLLICSFVTTLIIVSSSFLAPDIDFTILENPKHTPAHESKYPNVLLVVLDTVRMDHLSCYGYTQNETPNIDRMSREWSSFPQCVLNRAVDSAFPRINVHRTPHVPTSRRLGPHLFSQRLSDTRGVPEWIGIPHCRLQ